MSEEQNVVEEAQPEVVLPDGLESADDAQQGVSEPAVGSQEYNWQQAREHQRRLEEDNRELRRAIEEIRAPKAPVAEDELSIADDDLVEGRHVRMIMQRLEAQLQQQKNEAVPDRLKARFPDFDDVVTKENVERLNKEEPELLASIRANPDVYAKGIAAYKLLKKSSPVENRYSNDIAKLEANRSRPGSVNGAARQSPLSEADKFAGGLTPELKRQLQAEVMEATRYL